MVNSIKPGSLSGYPSTALSGKVTSDAGHSVTSGSVPVSGSDRVELTPQTQAITEAAQGATGPSVDTAKVQALQQQIASGNYQVNAQSIAGKLSQIDGALGGN